MNSGRDATTAMSDGDLAPPSAPMAMPEQSIERRRRAPGFFGLFALRFFSVK